MFLAQLNVLSSVKERDEKKGTEHYRVQYLDEGEVTLADGQKIKTTEVGSCKSDVDAKKGLQLFEVDLFPMADGAGKRANLYFRIRKLHTTNR